MSEPIGDSTQAALATFIDKGATCSEVASMNTTDASSDIPLVLQSQQGAAIGFLTISTLVCAVAASTIQFSYAQTSSFFGVVNYTWFLSLGLSIAASVFILLKDLWKDTAMR